MVANVMGGHATCFIFALEAGIYLENKGSIEKIRDIQEIEPLLIANQFSVFYLSMV